MGKPLSFLVVNEVKKLIEKVIPFWSFIFPETYICYISCIYLYCYRGEKVHNNYLMGLIFSTSWSAPPRKKNSLWGYGFFKKGFKSNRFQVVVWSQNLRFSYFSFLKGFPAKKMASLARTVLKPFHAIDLLPPSPM